MKPGVLFLALKKRKEKTKQHMDYIGESAQVMCKYYTFFVHVCGISGIHSLWGHTYNTSYLFLYSLSLHLLVFFLFAKDLNQRREHWRTLASEWSWIQSPVDTRNDRAFYVQPAGSADGTDKGPLAREGRQVTPRLWLKPLERYSCHMRQKENYGRHMFWRKRS